MAAQLVNHLAFYVGWPRAMSALAVAKEVFGADGARDGGGSRWADGRLTSLTRSAIDAAYRDKYRNYGSSFVDPMVTEIARNATIKLVPR